MATTKSTQANRLAKQDAAKTTPMPNAKPCLAEVVDWSYEAGLLTVATSQGEWPVTQIMHSVLPVAVGDQVLLQVVNGDWCAVNRLVNADDLDRPQLTRTDEGWVLSSQKTVTLQVGKANLTLSPDGDVQVTGRDIVSEAEGVQRIVGERIELN